MTLEILVTDEAIADLEQISDYLTDQARSGTAHRFVDAVARAFERLAYMPGIGVHADLSEQKLHDMRSFIVPEFRNYLIFYQLTERELIIRRVLHGARDIGRIFHQP